MQSNAMGACVHVRVCTNVNSSQPAVTISEGGAEPPPPAVGTEPCAPSSPSLHDDACTSENEAPEPRSSRQSASPLNAEFQISPSIRDRRGPLPATTNGKQLTCCVRWHQLRRLLAWSDRRKP